MTVRLVALISLCLTGSATAQEGMVLKGNGQPVRCLAFSPDGKLLASGGADAAVRLWEPASGRELRILKGHFKDVTAVGFSADGKLLASGAFDGSLKLWNSASGEAITPRNPDGLFGHEKWISAIAFAPNGKDLFTAGADRLVKVWRVSSGRLVSGLPGHEHELRALVLRPDGQRLASAGGKDKTVRVWDIEALEEVDVWKAPFSVTALVYSPDGGILIAATGRAEGEDDVAGVVTLLAGDTLKERSTIRVSRRAVFALAVSPDGKTLATGGKDTLVRLWDLASGKEMAKFPGHDDEVTALGFSPDGTRLASASEDGTVRLWSPVNAGK